MDRGRAYDVRCPKADRQRFPHLLVYGRAGGRAGAREGRWEGKKANRRNMV